MCCVVFFFVLSIYFSLDTDIKLSVEVNFTHCLENKRYILQHMYINWKYTSFEGEMCPIMFKFTLIHPDDFTNKFLA